MLIGVKVVTTAKGSSTIEFTAVNGILADPSDDTKPG
jgi:hypothetical protein